MTQYLTGMKKLCKIQVSIPQASCSNVLTNWPRKCLQEAEPELCEDDEPVLDWLTDEAANKSAYGRSTLQLKFISGINIQPVLLFEDVVGPTLLEDVTLWLVSELESEEDWLWELELVVDDDDIELVSEDWLEPLCDAHEVEETDFDPDEVTDPE